MKQIEVDGRQRSNFRSWEERQHIWYVYFHFTRGSQVGDRHLVDSKCNQHAWCNHSRPSELGQSIRRHSLSLRGRGRERNRHY